MHLRPLFQRALVVASTGLLLATTTASAFGPTTTVTSDPPVLAVGDLASRGGDLFLTAEGTFGLDRTALPWWSTDGGASWTPADSIEQARETQVTICDGEGVMVAGEADAAGATDWRITMRHYSFDGAFSGSTQITPIGNNRKPDVACIANQRAAVVWYRKTDGVHRVQLVIRRIGGEDLNPQAFNVGQGSMAKGLAVAASSQRVLVAWVDGDALKVRRYSVGPGPDFLLTSLGTTTIATHRSIRDPRIDVDGQKAIIAYQHQADLRVRRSFDRGASWGPATTLRNHPYPSEIATSPTTVDLQAKRVAIGAIQLSGVETLQGVGLGWFSGNFGVSWKLRAKHSGGRTVAAVFKDGLQQEYAEAWDQSVSQPASSAIRFRRD